MGFSGGEKVPNNPSYLSILGLLYGWQLAVGSWQVGVCWHILAYHFQFVVLHLTFSLRLFHWYNHNVTLRAAFASCFAFPGHILILIRCLFFPPKVFPLHFFTALLLSNRCLCTLPQDPARPRNVPDLSSYHHICPSLLYHFILQSSELRYFYSKV